jgi:hypothetical protein
MVKDSFSGISTNFSHKNLSDDYFEMMQNFKIVYVSMSGITPGIYSLYHRGGNLEWVMANIEKLAAKKRTQLVIRWLSHEDNQHQYKDAAKIFTDMGYDMEPVPLNCEVEEIIENFDHRYLRKPRFRCRKEGFRCISIHRPTIGVNGEHFVCCTSHNVPVYDDSGTFNALTVDNDGDISRNKLMRLKKKTELCRKCQEVGAWRMWS